jgi:alkylation response protein AidB-like acyl-CoA dehydrogenase
MFELTEEQRMVEHTFRQFMEKEVAPHLEKLEKGEMLPYDICRKMMKLIIGDGGDGGIGLREDPMMSSVMIKELSRVSPGYAVAWGATVGLAGMTIMSKGTADQRNRYGLPLLTIDKIGAWGLTEPGAGSDAFGAMKAKAKPTDKGYILNGSKTFITNAPYADIFVIYAKVDRGQPRKEQAVNAFIVERGTDGLSTGPPLDKMGLKDSPTGEIFLDDVEVPAENLLGGEEKTSFRDQAKDSLGSERSGIAPVCLGIIEKCYEQSVQYSKERVQFDKPIGEYQAVQLKLANMYIHLQNVWNIVYRLAWMQKNKKKDVPFICTSKVYCSKAAVEVALDAIQIHGGYGYMSEYHVEKLMRDAKLMEIGAGTSDINLMYAMRLELDIH